MMLSYPVMVQTLNVYNAMADVICVTGDVRLIGGSNPLEGRLEVCFFNQWGTICSGSWGQNEAGVVCSQLGYARTGIYDNVYLLYTVLCLLECGNILLSLAMYARYM